MTATTQEHTVEYRLEILGEIWWPMGEDYSWSKHDTKTLTAPITDELELAEAILAGNRGDFSDVLDYSVSIRELRPCGHFEWRIIKDWDNEDTAGRFALCESPYIEEYA